MQKSESARRLIIDNEPLDFTPSQTVSSPLIAMTNDKTNIDARMEGEISDTNIAAKAI